MTQVQNFKGDTPEIKMLAVAEPAFDLTEGALDDFFENGPECDKFLLALYDDGRVPFSERIARDVFIPFIKKALANFPFTGTFETYLFILREIFGNETDILFDVDAPGTLSISVNAASDVVYEALGREFIDGAYEFFNIGDSDGEDLIFRGISGIDSEYELGLLFAEIMPAGIIPDIALEFFSKSIFIAEEDSSIYDVVDHLGNQIVFIEIGG